jgi:hypothetical protein
MISCPLCKRLVLDGKENEADKVYLHDHELQDFWCPTYVDVHPGVRWCHYYRQTMKGWHPEYIIIVPPFRVTWTTGINWITIQKFNAEPNDWSRCYHIETIKEQTFEDFLKVVDRMKKLKAFA